jgi:hypothetical protein
MVKIKEPPKNKISNFLFWLFVILVPVFFIFLFIQKTRWITLRFGWIIFLILGLSILVDLVCIIKSKRPKIIPYRIVNFYGSISVSLITTIIILLIYSFSVGTFDLIVIKRLISALLILISFYILFFIGRKIEDKNKIWKSDLLFNFSTSVFVAFIVAVYSFKLLNDNFVLIGSVIVFLSYRIYNHFRRLSSK